MARRAGGNRLARRPVSGRTDGGPAGGQRASVPQAFLWVEGLLVAIVAVLGLWAISTLANCGDLCLGGAVGIALLAVSGAGLLGIAVWKLAGRAFFLLAWNAVVILALVFGRDLGLAPVVGVAALAVGWAMNRWAPAALARLPEDPT